MDEVSFYIEFCDHVTQAHRDGIVEELLLMNSVVTQTAGCRFVVVAKPSRSLWIEEFLRQQDKEGTIYLTLLS